MDWTFGGTWPFPPRYLQTPGGPLHYVAEGPPTGPVVLLVHGNPTWGYLYRHFVSPLAGQGARVVVPDLLGFGRSAKPPEPRTYGVDAHASRLGVLLDHVGAGPVTVVAHDWGGPVALAWAAADPGRLDGLVLFNTFAPSFPGPLGGGLDWRLLRAATRVPGVARFVYQRRHALVHRFLFDQGLARPGALDATARRAYLAPHPRPADRAGIAAFARQVAGWGGSANAALDRLAPRLGAIPVTLAWGMRDRLFGPDVLAAWRQILPGARVVELDGAGHYVPEEEPAACLDAVAALLGAA